MATVVRYAALICWVWLMLAGVCLGKEVYLTDGGIVDCKSFRLRGDLVIVNINRDTVIEFERKEVDLRRTLRHSGEKLQQGRRKRPDIAAAQSVATKATSAVVASPSPVKPPVAAAAPVAKPAAAQVSTSAPKPVPAPAPAVAAKPVSPPAPIPVAPTPAPEPTVKEPAKPEATAKDATESSTPLDKAETERRIKQAAAMMSEAIRNKDPEQMKKAMELQQSTVPQEKRQQARVWGIKLVLMVLVCLILIQISMWAIFAKAGEAGWKSLVPLYNYYLLMVVAGKPGWWSIPAISVVLLSLVMPGMLFVVGIIYLVCVVLHLMAMLSLAERFGKGALFGIGLTFLPMFFFPLLAFGGAQIEEFEFSEA